MPLFDWHYIKSSQIGIKQLLGCATLNLGYHLSDSRMKWYWRSVNPNLILWCIHQPVNIYRICLKRYLICAVVVRSIAFLQKLQNKIKKKKKYYFKVYKKTVSFFWKLTKMFKLILCISEIPKTFIFVRVRQVTFLSEDWKNVSIWSSVLFTVSALEVCEREAYRKQTGSNVPVLLNKVATLEHDRFCRFHFRLSNDYLQVLKPES